MTLDEQIEWLEQKVKDSYKSANNCLNNDDVEGCYKFSGDIYRYQLVINSLKFLKTLSKTPPFEEKNNDKRRGEARSKNNA